MQRPSLSSEDSLLAVDSDGRITCISSACMNILHTEYEPVGRKLEAVLGKSSDLVSACHEMLRHPEITYPYRLRFGLTDDASKNILASLRPLKRSSKTVGVIITLKDLRQIRREEIRIRRTERLNMLARLAASLAHEIRNPLNAIVINLEVLKNVIKQLPPKSLQKANGYAGVLSEELERLNNALDNFLGLANPIEVMRSDIEVNQIVEDALTLIRHQAEQAGIETRESLDSSPIYVEGNADQLKQAIRSPV